MKTTSPLKGPLRNDAPLRSSIIFYCMSRSIMMITLIFKFSTCGCTSVESKEFTNSLRELTAPTAERIRFHCWIE